MSKKMRFPEKGHRVSFENESCFVCGSANRIGLRLKFKYDQENRRALATVKFSPEHQGWDGVVHGGLLAAVLDDAMAHAVFTLGHMGITTRMTVTYREAVLVGEEIFLEAVVTEVRTRVAKVRAIAFARGDDGGGEASIRCEAEGTYFLDSPMGSDES